MLPVLVGCLIVAIYNVWRFGSPVNDGHLLDSNTKFNTPLAIGLYGLLLSSGKSVFLYSPWTALSIGTIGRTIRNRDAKLGFLWFVTLTYLVFYAKLNNWGGDWAYGPRFMMAIVPILCILAAVAMDRVVRSSIRARIAVAGLLSISFAVQLPGVLVDPSMRMENLSTTLGGAEAEFELRTWDPYYCPISDQTFAAMRLIRGESAWLGRAHYQESSMSLFSRRAFDFWWVYVYRCGFISKFIGVAVFCLLLLCGSGLLILGYIMCGEDTRGEACTSILANE